MGLIRVPSSASILARYRPLWNAIYEATDSALMKAALRFVEEGVSFDANVHAADTRLYLRDRLDALGHDVEFEREQVNNCGLSLRRDPLIVKIFKSGDGRLPPAHTKARKRHYTQEGPWQYSLWTPPSPDAHDRELDDLDFGPLKLVAYWYMAPMPSLRLVKLKLALPNGVGNPPYWDEPIDPPAATMVTVFPQTKAPMHSDDIEGLRLLPLEPTGDDDGDGSEA